MDDTIPSSRRPKWLWIALIALVAVFLLYVLVDPSGPADNTVASSEEVNTEGFVVEPSGAAVPVTLPEVTMVSPVGEPGATESPTASETPAPTP